MAREERPLAVVMGYSYGDIGASVHENKVEE